MNTHYRDRRKIDPTKGALLPDGSANDNDRVEIGPTQLAYGRFGMPGWWRRSIRAAMAAS
jgi:hypothetical protein